MMQQQSRYNRATLAALQRLAVVLAGYLTGQAREIAALSREVAALKARLDAQERQDQP
jgi:hypothetical protein